MKNINWRVRAKSPQFWIGIIGVIMTPILTYYGMNYSDITTWQSLGNLLLNVISNPFVIGSVIMSVIGVITDPTTSGLKDSEQALEYKEPRK